MTGKDTNTKGTTTMDAATWGEGIERQIAEMEKALRECKAGRNIEDDPSELKAEIVRLKRLLD